MLLIEYACLISVKFIKNAKLKFVCTYVSLLQLNWTPLHVAVQNGHVLAVETLIRLGANVDTINNVSYLI